MSKKKAILNIFLCYKKPSQPKTKTKTTANITIKLHGNTSMIQKKQNKQTKQNNVVVRIH